MILGVALWLRHDNQTSSLLLLQFEGQQAPGTFYISEYRFLSCSFSCRNQDFLLKGSMLCPCSHLYYPSQSSVLQPCRVNCNAAIDPPTSPALRKKHIYRSPENSRTWPFVCNLSQKRCLLKLMLCTRLERASDFLFMPPVTSQRAHSHTWVF